MKVYIVGNDIDIHRMWVLRSKDNKIADTLEEADVVQFIGGADINPELYGEKPIEKTFGSAVHDKMDMDAWGRCKPHQLKVGICRGGQFLNVVNGGAMWQHIEGHRGWKGHYIRDVLFDKEIMVSSTHHQMMIPGDKGELLGFAKNVAKGHSTNRREGRSVPKVDPEIIWYYETKSLCFQPHPEINGFADCRNYYFELIDRLYEPQKKKA